MNAGRMGIACLAIACLASAQAPFVPLTENCNDDFAGPFHARVVPCHGPAGDAACPLCRQLPARVRSARHAAIAAGARVTTWNAAPPPARTEEMFVDVRGRRVLGGWSVPPGVERRLDAAGFRTYDPGRWIFRTRPREGL